MGKVATQGLQNNKLSVTPLQIDTAKLQLFPYRLLELAQTQ